MEHTELFVEIHTRRVVTLVLAAVVVPAAEHLVQCRYEFLVLFFSTTHPAPSVVKRLYDAHLATTTFEKLKTWAVVIKRNVGPVYTLPFVLFLLKLEQVAIEVALQALIRVVDEQLLEPVRVKVLEPVNIQHPNEPENAALRGSARATHGRRGRRAVRR